MKTRPWPIVILAVLHFLGPLGNVFLSAYLQRTSVGQYLRGLFETTSFWGLADFFLTVPLAGYAIWRCTKWSYPVFLGSAALTVYTNFESWRSYPEHFPRWLFLATIALDVLFVGYFLLPQVRAPFMNPRLRWWESKPRYLVRFEGTLQMETGTPACTLQDLSEGGAFVKSEADLPVGTLVRLAFNFHDGVFETPAKVVYQGKGPRPGFGLQFELDSKRRHELRRLIRNLREAGVKERMDIDLMQDFQAWLSRLVRTGKGLVPEFVTPSPAIQNAENRQEPALTDSASGSSKDTKAA